MGRLIIIVLLFALISFCSANAQNINIDKETAEQVYLNTASQLTKESIHSSKVDSITSKQKKISLLKTSYCTMKDLYHKSQTYAKEFADLRNPYTKEIIVLSARIVKNIPRALYSLVRSNGKLPVKSLKTVYLVKEMVDLSLKFNSLVLTYSKVVANKEPKSLNLTLVSDNVSVYDVKTTDSYNFLNREDRLALANDILYQLRLIDVQLTNIIDVCRYCNSVDTVIYELSPKIWALKYENSNLVNIIISDLKKL